MKKLNNTILFTDGVRCSSVRKLMEKDYGRLEALYQENNIWKVKEGTFDGEVFLSHGEEFELQFKGESELPNDYYIMDMMFAEKTDGAKAMSGLTCIASFAEVVAHFWNREKVPIRMIGYYAGTAEGERKHSATMYYPMTRLAVDANESGFYDEEGTFWRVPIMR